VYCNVIRGIAAKYKQNNFVGCFRYFSPLPEREGPGVRAKSLQETFLLVLSGASAKFLTNSDSPSLRSGEGAGVKRAKLVGCTT